MSKDNTDNKDQLEILKSVAEHFPKAPSLNDLLFPAIQGMARVEEFNDQFRQPNPNGKYPLCKPQIGNVRYCERCNNAIISDTPCSFFSRSERWGEDSTNYIK